MSSLGNSLYNARKSKGLTQEEVAEKLGVSRQTISKWELDETLPDIRQAKSLAQLYRTTLDDLLQYDAQVEEIQRVIRHTSEETQQKVDWTKLWGEMYPVLTTYPSRWTSPATPRPWRRCSRIWNPPTTTRPWTPFWCSRSFWARCGQSSTPPGNKHAKEPPQWGGSS